MVQGSQGGRHGLDERFRQLFDRHGEEIFRFFVRRGVPAEDARDLTQETFVRVYQGMRGFRGDSQPRTWVFSIAQNVFRNSLRHDGASKRQGDEVPLETATSDDGPEQPHSPLSDPFAMTLARERQEALYRAIDDLPGRMRQCVIQRVVHGLKYQEIADTLHVSVDTVKSQLHQAKERLRRALDDETRDEDEPGGPS